MFKAISTSGPEGIYQDIRSGVLFGKALNDYLFSGCAPDEIHKFNEVIENIKKKKKCFVCRQQLPIEQADPTTVKQRRRRRRGGSSEPSGHEEGQI